MKARNPVARPLKQYASLQPGGVIRWSEAQRVYRQHTSGDRDGYHFNMRVTRVLRQHFTKVEGVRGFYMLDSMLVPEETDDLEPANP